MATEQRLQIQRIATRTPSDGQEMVPFVRKLDYDYTDASDDPSLLIDATSNDPLLITHVINVIRTAFAGTSPTVDVGDGSTVDLWCDQSSIAQDTAGDVVTSLLDSNANGGGGACTGKWYTSAAQVKVTIGGTSLTAGAGSIYVHCMRVSPS